MPVRVIQSNLAAAGASTLTVSTFDISVNSLGWDPKYQKMYLSLPSINGANGNAVQVP
jgi:hypothetical protein